MTAKVWLAQLWAENLLGVLARSRTLYEELAWLVSRGEQARVLAVLPLCYQEPVKNPVDAYLRAWGYLRPLASPVDTTVFLRLLQERAPELNAHLYRLVLRHRLWYLYNSRLFPLAACPDRFWTALSGGMSQVVMTRDGADARPWAWFARELDALSGADPLVARAEAELVVLRVGGDLCWNPKLEGLPGSIALIERLRAAGRPVRSGLRWEAASG